MKLLLFIFLAGSFFINAAEAQAKRTNQTNIQTSEKITYEPDVDLLREMQKKVRVVESKQDWAKLDRQRPVNNSRRTRSVYIAQFDVKDAPNGLLDVIVVNETATGTFYELRGFDDYPWRPFSDFKWISNDVVQFEQWVNPHNGGRYRVNVKTGTVVAAGYVRSN